MLILSRHVEETIVIRTPEGRDIVLTVVELRGDRARIGIKADIDITVNRGEIQRLIDYKQSWTQPPTKGADQ